MFRRTYQIIDKGRFVGFRSKAVDFEEHISVSLIGRESHGAEHINILGLEYEEKIFPFLLGENQNTGIKYKNVSACEMYLAAYPREKYENNRASFSIDVERIVFDYETIEQYEKNIALMHEALNTLEYQYGSAVSGNAYPEFFYDIRCSEIPPNMQPEDNAKKVISGKELLYGTTNNPEELGLSRLRFLEGTGMAELYRDSRTKDGKKIWLHHEQLVKKFGGIEKIRKVKAAKQDKIRDMLISHVDNHTIPKNPADIVLFFEDAAQSDRYISLELAMAEIIELVAVNQKQHYYGNLISFDRTICLTTLPVIKGLKLCYEKEAKDSFDNFESFLVKLALYLEKECTYGNAVISQDAIEQRENKHENFRNEYNKKNRFKFWKKLI